MLGVSIVSHVSSTSCKLELDITQTINAKGSSGTRWLSTQSFMLLSGAEISTEERYRLTFEDSGDGF